LTAQRLDRSFASRIQLTGHGLVLREWTDDDLPAMVDQFDDPEVDRWAPLRAPFNLDAAHDYLGEARHLRTNGQRMQLAVTIDGNTPLGEILLSRADHAHTPSLRTPSAPGMLRITACRACEPDQHDQQGQAELRSAEADHSAAHRRPRQR
jgi:hypothetical protein